MLLKSTQLNSNQIVFSITWMLVLVYRYLVLENFGFTYTDADQTIMWNGLKNFSSNEWHEPRFYGQNYNSMFEAIIAVPLLKMGLPANFALPIVTTIICLTPYFLLFRENYRKEKFTQAFIITCIPLLLPYEYALISTMPRGFLPGIFFASLAVYQSEDSKLGFGAFRFGLLSVIGFSLNPNAAFLLIPFAFDRIPVFLKKLSLLLPLLFGAALGLMLHFLAQYYYVVHPETVVHSIMGTEFEMKHLINHFADLDKMFNTVCPLFWHSGFLVLILLLVLAFVLLRQKQYERSIAFFLLPVALIASLGLAKTNDGTNSVIFPYSRLYLALPLVLGTGIGFIRMNSKLRSIAIVLPIIFFSINLDEVSRKIPNKIIRNDIIAVSTVEKFNELCNTINLVCKKNEIDLILIGEFYFKDMVNYGCSSCVTDFPATLRLNYERRTWLTEKYKDSVFKNILVIDPETRFSELNPIELNINETKYCLYLNNRLKTKDFIFNSLSTD